MMDNRICDTCGKPITEMGMYICEECGVDLCEDCWSNLNGRCGGCYIEWGE
ncbi:hypothetical protein FDC06_08050 [Clostridium botulinum]|nr:hypothetical protein DBN47_15175 [Clostridium botulinum]NEZ96959.1 hypothetical protein [Clostridium botulinum]NFA26114.1 hypothetical protein [Clostridium botulinum]NFD56101.1 hypothetical protein [Clostridium botulinum]NFF83932.1 hypothetical protein [Clostridium botulinum]